MQTTYTEGMWTTPRRRADCMRLVIGTQWSTWTVLKLSDLNKQEPANKPLSQQITQLKHSASLQYDLIALANQCCHDYRRKHQALLD